MLHHSTFSSWSEFLPAVRAAGVNPNRPDSRLHAAASGNNTTVPSEGGYLVPSELAGELLARVYSGGDILSRVTRRSPTTGRMVFAAIDESSRADGSRFGGMRCYWAEEGGTVTRSYPRFARIEPKLRRLTGLVPATDELVSDAFDWPATFTDLATRELVWKVEHAIVTGSGAGQPLGLRNASCKIEVTRDATTAISAQDVRRMFARLWGPCRANAVWLASESCTADVLGVGDGLIDYAGGRVNLIGRPVLWSEHCSALGTAGDLVLTDLSQYVAIDRDQEIASSMHVEFDSAQQVFRASWRFDGQPTWQSALTPANGGDSLSCTVVLETK